MRLPIVLAVGFTLAGWSGLALADPGKDESGKGRRGGYERYGYGGDWEGRRERKIKVRTADGCEIERKWKKGKYEEKVKCKPSRYGYRY